MLKEFLNSVMYRLGWMHCLNCKQGFRAEMVGGIAFKGGGGTINVLHICGECLHDPSRLNEDEIGYRLHALGAHTDDILTAQAKVREFVRKGIRKNREEIGIA